jgi:hypothetical protein
MVGNDRSIVNALAIITTIAVTKLHDHRAEAALSGFGRGVDGMPLVLFQRGR